MATSDSDLVRETAEQEKLVMALRASEEQFRQLADNVDEVLWLTDWTERKLLYVNPAYETIYGRSRQSLHEDRRSWIEAVHPDDRSRVAESFARHAKLGQPVQEEYRIIRPDGGIHWVHDRAFPIRDEAGQVTRIVGIAQCITERKRVEEALRKERELLQTLLESAPDTIYFKDLDGRFTRISRSLADFLGMDDPQKAVGKTDFDFFPREDAGAYRRDERVVLQTGTPIIGQTERCVDAHGRVRWFSTTKVPIKDDEGRVTGLVGMSRDITDRKRAADALHESENRFRQLAETISEVFWLTDWTNNKVLYVSPAYERIYGRSCQSLYEDPRSWADAIHPEDKDRVVESFQRDAESGSYDQEYRVVHDDGSERWIRDRAFPICDVGGRVCRVAGLSEDITQRKLAEAEREDLHRRLQAHAAELEASKERLEAEIAQRIAAEDRLRHEAHHDRLTNLPNRTLLLSRLRRCIQRAQRSPDASFRYAVLFLDIDDFKIINESLGHAAGDALLVMAAERLVECVRGLDTVGRCAEHATARFGGDEFVVLLEDLRSPTDAVVVAERIGRHLSAPFELEDQEIVISSSIGIATSNGKACTAEDLLRDADAAVYRAKAAGQGRYEVFDPEMHARATERLRLDHDLRRALQEDEFELAYQPLVVLESGQLEGFEALLRWRHPQRGLVSPLEFIATVEENGLIVPIGLWVLREACDQLNAWAAQLPSDRRVSISVNVSKRQILEPRFVEELRQILLDTGVADHSLRLEVTESDIVGKDESLLDGLRRIRELGIELHMDDFGTGVSSLSCLHRFPIDVLKIDRAFITTMSENRQYAAVVHAVVTLAHNLGMKVVAEGIETAEQMAQMLALECDYGQGYFFSKPVERDRASELLARGVFGPSGAVSG